MRSVFLTALMVFAVFAGTVAFTGTAAAEYPELEGDPIEFTAPGGTNHIEVMYDTSTAGTIPTADSAYTLEDRNGDPVTATVNTGLSNVTAGRIILNIGEDLNGEPTLTIDDGAEDDEFDVITTASTIEDPGDVNSGTDADGADLTDADAEVFKGERVAVMNLSGPEVNADFDVREGGEVPFLSRSTGAGSFIGTIDTGAVNALAAGDTYYLTFENSGSNTSLGVRDLGLSIEADDNEYDFTDGESVDIEVTASSNVAGRQVEFRLKEDGDYEDENVTQTLGGDGEFTQEFTVDDDGNYSVEVVDLRTDISDETDSITVTEVTGDASFTRGVFTEQRGDVARITVNMQNRETATVNIGGEDVGFLATVDIEDDDDDGQVTFLMNTYNPGVASSYVANDEDDEVDLNTSTGASVLFTTPLASASYTMNVTNGGVSENLEGSGFDEYDRASLNLRDRSTEALRTWVAPAGSQSDFEDGAAIADYIAAGNLTQDSTIANGDDVVLQLQASGLEGAINATIDAGASDGVEAIDDLEDDGVLNVTFYQSLRSKAPNADQVSFELSDMSSSEVILDPQNNTVFIAFDSSQVVAQDPDLEIDDVVVANVTLNDRDTAGDNALVPRNDRQTVTSQFRVVDDEVEFDTNDDDLVIVRAAADQQITGTSTLAAGTEITVSASSTGASAFLLDNDTIVQPDGTFAAVLDFSNITAGQNFTVDVTGTSLENDPEEDGRVVAAATSSVTFRDQSTDGSQVTVASASLSEGGFVTIHDSTLQDGEVIGSIRGTSSYLESGSSSGITVMLDDPVMGTETLIAMPHMDTNGNQQYDFVTSEGAEDGPYTADGQPVTDSAEVSVSTPTATPTATPEPTPTATAEPTATPEPEPTATAEPSTPEPTTGGDGAGFGVVVALIALIGAALLAVRRNE